MEGTMVTLANISHWMSHIESLIVARDACIPPFLLPKHHLMQVRAQVPVTNLFLRVCTKGWQEQAGIFIIAKMASCLVSAVWRQVVFRVTITLVMQIFFFSFTKTKE